MPRPLPEVPSRQLALPFPPRADPAPPSLPPDLATLRAAQVWRTLPSSTRMQVQQALRQVIQEVIHDSDAAC